MISIIVPIYNTEKYLPRCLDSILGQTYKDLEVILVDDGSTDGSGQICDDYAAEDGRFTVIHKEHKGLSDTKNAGLENARGEYIGSVDSDDYIEPDMFERLYAALKDNDADISCCARYTEYENKRIASTRRKDLMVLTNEQALQMIMKSSELNMDFWDKLYKAELFAGFRFPEAAMYEDNYAVVTAFHRSDRVAYIPLPLYHYVQRAGSVTHTDTPEIMRDAFRAKRHVRDFVHHDHPIISDAADVMLMLEYVSILNRYLRNGRFPGAALREEIQKSVKDNWPKCRRSDGLPGRAKPKVFLVRYFFPLYCICYRAWKQVDERRYERAGRAG